MIIKIKPDKQKAISLLKIAEITLKRLKETDTNKYPSNTLIDYYDALHKIMGSLAYIEGIKLKGDGAHQELIDYICKEYKIDNSIRLFLQEMRDYRNRISYEGFMVNENYIKLNHKKIEEIINRLLWLVKL